MKTTGVAASSFLPEAAGADAGKWEYASSTGAGVLAEKARKLRAFPLLLGRADSQIATSSQRAAGAKQDLWPADAPFLSSASMAGSGQNGRLTCVAANCLHCYCNIAILQQYASSQQLLQYCNIAILQYCNSSSSSRRHSSSNIGLMFIITPTAAKNVQRSTCWLICTTAAREIVLPPLPFANERYLP